MVPVMTLYAMALEPVRIGERLPSLRGEFLTGRNAALPEASTGKTTLLLLGFTYASRDAVEPWGEWFRTEMSGRPDVTFFEVPMIDGLAKLGRWFIDRGMRKGTPQELHENVMTVYGGTGDWKRRLGVTDTNDEDAFLILLDRQGVVRWLHHGPFDAAMATLLKNQLASSTVSTAP